MYIAGLSKALQLTERRKIIRLVVRLKDGIKDMNRMLNITHHILRNAGKCIVKCAKLKRRVMYPLNTKSNRKPYAYTKTPDAMNEKRGYCNIVSRRNPDSAVKKNRKLVRSTTRINENFIMLSVNLNFYSKSG